MDQPPSFPIALQIDVEPDEFFPEPDSPGRWDGFPRAVETMAALRPRLAELTSRPVHLTWRLRADPAIATAFGSQGWLFQEHGDLLEDLAAEGDELAVHVHLHRWREGAGWIVDQGDFAWVRHCLESSTRVFTEALGYSPRTLGFGDGWISTETLNLAADLGYHADTTIEPGRGTRPCIFPERASSGTLPDFTSCPRGPYRPGRADFRVPDTAPPTTLWALPISTTSASMPEFLRHSVENWQANREVRALPAGRAATHARRGGLARAWEMVRRKLADLPERASTRVSPQQGAASFRALFRRLRSGPGGGALVTALRSQQFLSPTFRDRLGENLRWLAQEAHLPAPEFTTVTGTIALLEPRHEDPAR